MKLSLTRELGHIQHLEFSRKDCMNLDVTLSKIILSGLIKFREELLVSGAIGIPSSVMKEVTEDKGTEEWLKILDEMIHAFSEDPFCLNPSKEDIDRSTLGRELFAKHFQDLWW